MFVLQDVLLRPLIHFQLEELMSCVKCMCIFSPQSEPQCLLLKNQSYRLTYYMEKEKVCLLKESRLYEIGIHMSLLRHLFDYS